MSVVVSPSQDFYNLYSESQIKDLMDSIEYERELPLKYAYFGKGADYFSAYVERLSQESTHNSLNCTIELLTRNYAHLLSKLDGYERVEIIDIGPGNAMPVKGLLTELLKVPIVITYVPVDTSPDVLQMVERNVHRWFNDAIELKKYRSDIEQTQLNLKFDSDDSKIIRIFLLFGGTLSNFPKPQLALKHIHASMRAQDIFIHSQKLDTAATREYFNLSQDKERGRGLLPELENYLVADLLCIPPSIYDVEMGYDPKLAQRYMHLRFNQPATLLNKINNRQVNIQHGDAILIWRARQLSSGQVISMFEASDFELEQSSQTDDQEHMLTISHKKR